MALRGFHWKRISCKEAKLAAFQDMREHYNSIGKTVLESCTNPITLKRIKDIVDTADEIADNYKHYKN